MSCRSSFKLPGVPVVPMQDATHSLNKAGKLFKEEAGLPTQGSMGQVSPEGRRSEHY